LGPKLDFLILNQMHRAYDAKNIADTTSNNVATSLDTTVPGVWRLRMCTVFTVTGKPYYNDSKHEY